MLNFPNSPVVGQQFTVGNTTWVFDGTKWVTSSVAVNMPAPGTALPLMDGTAAVGTSYLYTRQDHVHPTDTSRYAASNPSNYQTGAQVTASLGGYLPLSGGTLSGALTVNSTVVTSGTVSTGNQSQGFVQLNAGNSSNTGYVSFFMGGTRRGYIGYSDGSNLSLNADGINLSISAGTTTINGNFSAPGVSNIANLTVGSGGLWAANGTTDLSTTNMHASTTYVSNANHIPTNNACASGYGGQAWNQVGSYSFFNASDPRDKKHIMLSPEGALDEVIRVPVVRYRWSIDDDDAPVHTGFLATDVAEVLGYDRAAVMVGPDEAKSMGLNLLDMIATLWQAVQELSAEVGR